MIQSIILIIVGFILLIKGADFLVDGASYIAKKFHIPEIVIGLTVVSIGTSMPELVVSIASAINGYPDMAVGNVVGSNIANLLLVLGMASTIKAVKFKRETRLIETPLCLIFTVIFLIICNVGQNVTRAEGIILISLFIGFIAYTIFMAKKGNEFDKDDEKEEEKEKNKKEKSTLMNIAYIIFGIAALKFGGDLTVSNAVNVAEMLHLSEKVISLTILAIGTSLPELVTSVAAAIKGKSDIAIGNIIGSNIFNMLLIIGISSIIKPITYNMTYNTDMSILLFATIILALFPLIPPKNKMSRSNGLVYLFLYAVYMFILFK